MLTMQLTKVTMEQYVQAWLCQSAKEAEQEHQQWVNKGYKNVLLNKITPIFAEKIATETEDYM